MMMSFDPIYLFWGGLLLLVPGVAAAVALSRAIRRRNRARRRVVERPNSHYTSPVVRNNETRHHWHTIPLERVHEINRGEVTRLLARVDVSGVDSLRPTERTFLEQVAAMTGTVLPAAADGAAGAAGQSGSPPRDPGQTTGPKSLPGTT